ncbi:MAG: hypothetical protein HQL08_15235 [Nitrospirae bacterium]|nr:hypothetical protein [Nitrospirota bacterium]
MSAIVKVKMVLRHMIIALNKLRLMECIVLPATVLLLVSCGGRSIGGSNVNSSQSSAGTNNGNVTLGSKVTGCGSISAAGTYTLQNDVSSNGTCFTVTSANVTLDLNGHTVTYDNEAPIIIPNGSFESALTGTWDISNAANISRHAGTYVAPVTVYDGSYAMQWSLPTSDQYIQTSGTVALEANTTYSLSAMFYVAPTGVGSPDGIALTVSMPGTSWSATQTGMTYRGFQYTNVEFTTTSAGSYPVRVALSGAGSSTGYVYVDDVRIVKSRSYGVYVGPGYSNANYLTVTNGSIVQGQGAGYKSAGISFYENSGTGQNINNLNITTNGNSSHVIEFPNGTTSWVNSQIYDNTLTSNVTTIKSRDQGDGAIIWESTHGSYGTRIYNNTITAGPQGGIVVGQYAGQTLNEVDHNNITLQAKYSNAFAMGSGGLVHDNIINCGSGLNTCRGIYAAGNGTQIYNNTISVQRLPNNQEYGTSASNGGQAGGCDLGGAYGIQAEDDTGLYVTNLAVYGNTVTAYSNQCEAFALRTDILQSGSSNNAFYSNTFTAIANGTVRASAFKNSGGADSRESISGNTFQSNRRWIYILTEEGEITGPLTLAGNKWVTTGTIDSPFHPFETSGIAGSLTFVNNTYGNSGDQASFLSDCFRTTGNFSVCSPNVTFSVMSP